MMSPTSIYESEVEEHKRLCSSFDKSYPILAKRIQTYMHLSDQEKIGLELFCYRFIVSKVVNAVCPIYTSKKIDLDLVEKACNNHSLEYKRHPKFTGMPIKFKTKDLDFTAMVFKSGKINIVGLKGDSEAHLAKVTSLLAQYEEEFLGYKGITEGKKVLANRVYSVRIPKLIPLDLLHLFNQISDWKSIKYNNQSFPGVIKKVSSCNAKILFFKTGSTIITGVKSDSHKIEILLEFIDLLVEYLNLRRKFRTK